MPKVAKAKRQAAYSGLVAQIHDRQLFDADAALLVGNCDMPRLGSPSEQER